MRAPPPKAVLEPMAAVFIGVALLHFLLGGILWGLLPLWQPAPYGGTPDMGKDVERFWFAPADYHREGTVFTPAAAEPAPVAAPPAPAKTSPSPVPAKTGPSQAVSSPSPLPTAGTLTDSPLQVPPPPVTTRTTTKVITLSPVVELPGADVDLVKPARPPVTMMDVLKQEQVEEAQKKATGGADMDSVLKALEMALKETWNTPPVSEVPVLHRDARLTVSISPDGGIHEVQLSKPSGSAVLDASVLEAGKAVKKISESLPSSFPKDRYIVEVNFHIE